MITEAVIEWKSQVGLSEFYNDAIELIELKSDRSNIDYLLISELRTIGDNNGIDVVTYEEFLDELPDELMHTAPPKRAGLFAMVNPNTNMPIVVVAISKMHKREIDYIYHMLKHEAIHIEQFSRRPDNVKHAELDPTNQSEYFSNKDEVMAFSHSIADMIRTSGMYSSVEDAMHHLIDIRLYNTIKKSVNAKILKRYHKYIYMYLQNEL